jgi:hypothetical protein
MELASSLGEEVEISESAWQSLSETVKKVVVKEGFNAREIPYTDLYELIIRLWAWSTTNTGSTHLSALVIWLHALGTKVCLPVFGEYFYSSLSFSPEGSS